jgi:hypothetical protein
MKTRAKRLLAVGLVFGAVGVSWLAYSFLSPHSSRNRASAMDCTLEWARLAPLPPSAQQLTISTHGSMFTREFRASFVAPPEDIEEWLRTSLGTREAVVTPPSPGVRHFQIKPGGGAEFAEVTVDDTQHRVSIHVYWS